MTPTALIHRSRQIAKMSHYCCEVRSHDDDPEDIIISMCGLGFDVIISKTAWVTEETIDNEATKKTGWGIYGMSADDEWKINNLRYENFDIACMDAIKTLRDYDFRLAVGVAQ